jgi:HK97 family phage major capsid protein
MPRDGDEIGWVELKGLIETSNKTFEEFKKSNDERIAQIESKGEADVITKEQTDALSEAVGQASGKVDAAIASLEQNQKAATESAEALERFEKEATDRFDGIETALKRTPLSGADKGSEIEIKHVVNLLRGESGKSVDEAEAAERVEEYKGYVAAFRHYIRKSNDKYGQDLSPEMRKALSVGIEADGGYWVIPEVSNQVKMRLFETSPIRSIAQVVSIGTDAIEFPTDTNDATSGGWVGETDARAETATPQTGMGRISVHEQFANPRATQKLLDDASFPVETWLANKIGDKLGRDENTAFVSGNGVAQPRGFLDYGSASVTTDDDGPRAWGALQYVPSTGASGFASSDPSDDLLNLVYKLNPAYRPGASWVMNRATLNLVRQFKDGQGNYLWSQGIGIDGLQSSSLIGFPITEAEDMDDVAADAFPIAFGNFSEGYMIVDREGIRTLRDPYSAKPYVQFYTTKRVGGDVVNFDAIKLFKIAAS